MCGLYSNYSTTSHQDGTSKEVRIYVGYESPSIIKYLEPSTGDLFTARFADCHFDEKLYPTLGGETKQLVIN